MPRNKGYGQYCPIAVASEIMAERWTPLVLRGLFCGAKRFNDLQASLPRMSSSLLSRRLRELEHAKIVERRPAESRRGSEYHLTEAGVELFPVLETMGMWAQKWLRREIVRDENLDPDLLMWELRRSALNSGRHVDKRRVVQFHLDGVPTAKRFYWLVFEPEEIDFCVRDPGFDVDLLIRCGIRALIEVRLGHRSLASALRGDSIRLDGAPSEIKAFHDWFVLSSLDVDPA